MIIIAVYVNKYINLLTAYINILTLIYYIINQIEPIMIKRNCSKRVPRIDWWSCPIDLSCMIIYCKLGGPLFFYQTLLSMQPARIKKPVLQTVAVEI